MDKLEQWQALLPLKDQAHRVARYGHPRGPETDHVGSRALVDIVEAFPEMVAQLKLQQAEIEFLRRRAVDPDWDAAVDWLLNSRHTADPAIQSAFWALSLGACTVDEADAGAMADGRTFDQARRDWEAGRCVRCGGLDGTHTVRGCAALDG